MIGLGHRFRSTVGSEGDHCRVRAPIGTWLTNWSPPPAAAKIPSFGRGLGRGPRLLVQ